MAVQFKQSNDSLNTFVDSVRQELQQVQVKQTTFDKRLSVAEEKI